MNEYILSECEKLCIRTFGKVDYDITPLKPSGSARKYFRLNFKGIPEEGRTEKIPSSALFCFSENLSENATFVKLSEYLREKNVPVPEIFGVSGKKECYLLQDLGDIDFMSVIKNTQHKDTLFPLLKEVMGELARFQTLPGEEWKTLVEFPPLGEDLIKYDFKYCTTNFFDACGVKYDEIKLQRDFDKMQEILLSYPEKLWGLMYRDFQSRNIMMAGSPYFIDYQSARRGPGIYDLVSFAWQAKAGFSSEERGKIIDFYCNALADKRNDEDREGIESAVKSNIPYWALFRILQTLGAYGLRGLKEGKAHFIESIPPALNNIKELATIYKLDAVFPELYHIVSFL